MQELPRVFVVDDDWAARESVVAMVTSKGVHAQGYASAEEFLDDFDPSWLGCLVTDVRMAGMSGVQLQETLRADGITLPVILISGYADVPTAVHTMRAGAVTFLEKPCREDDLWSAIGKAIEWHRRRREARRRAEWLEARFTQLTPGERDVMRAMVAGKPNKVIASELEIGLRTVELRRANVLQKTGAGSLAELVRLAVAADRMAEAVA
jgi:FixJ family two-component response regulator